MKINKNQALYRALPHSWINYSNSKSSDYKYSCEVIAWNTKPVQGINEEVIKRDILRSAHSFELAGGIVTDEFSEERVASFSFVEPSMNDGISDIKCEINPSTYYCPACGAVDRMDRSISAPICRKCNKKMNQLQMVYPCECGYCDGVKPIGRGLSYHYKDKDNQFKFFDEKGQKKEMLLKCPLCGNMLTPKNASDSRITYSQTGNIVNLYNQDYANALNKYKFDAEILMLAKWFGIVSHEEFLKFLENQKDFFEKKSYLPIDEYIIKLAQKLRKSPEEVASILNSADDSKTIDSVKNDISNILPLSLYENKKNELSLITSDLMEFDTLKNPSSLITMKEAIKKGIELGRLFDEKEILEFSNKLHLKNMQVSEAVQIVNYSYGYTRLRSCPDGTSSTKNLRLRGFENGKVFTSILNTEGILIELNMLDVYKWLCDNKIVTGDEIVDNDLESKKWFIENVNLESISHFSTIPGGLNLVTKTVYSLLHTISHMFIRSAGKHSGLSRDSISEIIFPSTCSIFIYPTSSEGVTLGSISGMFESELKLFLEDALIDNEICTFDPICKNNQNGACIACTYLSEVNCAHFNKDLSRAYLYGGNIKINDEEIVINRGFWK